MTMVPFLTRAYFQKVNHRFPRLAQIFNDFYIIPHGRNHIPTEGGDQISYKNEAKTLEVLKMRPHFQHL